MHLTVALIAAHIVIRFTTPGPGTYYLHSACQDEPFRYRKEASNYEQQSCNVSVTIKTSETHRIFWVEFLPDAEVKISNP